MLFRSVGANADFERSIKGVKTALADLFTLDPDGLKGAVEQIDRLAETLKDPAVQDGADKLVGSMVQIGGTVIEGWALLAGEVARVAQSFRDANPALDDAYERQEKLSRKIGETYERMQEIKRENRESSAGYEKAAERLAGYRAELEATRKEIDRLLKVQSLATPLEEIKVTHRKLAKPMEPEKLEEFRVTARRIKDVEYYANLDKLTQTSTEKQLKQLDQIESALNELYETGRINAEQFNERWGEALGGVLQEVEVTAKRIGDEFKQIFEELPPEVVAFKDQTEDVLADFVMTGKLHAKDLVNYFIEEFARIKVIRPMLNSVFQSGFNPFDFVGGLLGFADGGRPPVGKPSIVGERGPELFVPDGTGTIIPNHRLGGGAKITIQNNIDARGATQDFVKALPAILAESNRRAVQQARIAFMDDLSRGVRA